MQLIEIVQIVLLIFIALSAIIFFFSYLGYRAKSKILELPKSTSHSETESVRDAKVIKKSFEIFDEVEKHKFVKPQKTVKLTPRFELFTPTSGETSKSGNKKSHKKKSHSPKTLIIKHKS